MNLIQHRTHLVGSKRIGFPRLNYHGILSSTIAQTNLDNLRARTTVSRIGRPLSGKQTKFSVVPWDKRFFWACLAACLPAPTRMSLPARLYYTIPPRQSDRMRFWIFVHSIILSTADGSLSNPSPAQAICLQFGCAA